MDSKLDSPPPQGLLLPESWLVRDTVRESRDIVTLVLEPGNGSQAKTCQPGQFNMLYAFGVGEVPISISGDTADSTILVHTIRNVGAVTSALASCQPGDLVGVRGPFGSPWPVCEQRGRDIVIAAGGIGLVPLLPVIHQLARHRDDFDDIVLLYGTRSPEELIFSSQFDGWRDQGIQVEVTVDNASPDWPGHVGFVTTLIRHGRFDTPEASAFLCGPELMMRFTAQELENKGVAADRIWISMERNMKCAVGFCGHCQLGPEFICLDGPVFPWPRMRGLMLIREL